LYDWSYYADRGSGSEGLGMNDRTSARPFERAAENVHVPLGPDLRAPVRTLVPDVRFATVALVSRTKTPSLEHECTRSEKLVITVQINPAAIRQRWVMAIPSGTDARTSHEPLDKEARGSPSSRSAGGYAGVEYHLYRATLNEFTDTHGLQRIPNTLRAIPADCPVIMRLTHLILLGLETPQLFSPSFMEHFAMLFSAHIVQLLNVGEANKIVQRGGLSASQKRRAVEMLANDPCADVRLAAVAKQCGMSVSHFARSFKVSFGQSTHRWVIGLRIERAKRFLLCSDEPLIEIAHKTGFCDQASFNRTFTKVMGSSPGRWRRDFKA
jgi:AraC family transcriptional regulator